VASSVPPQRRSGRNVRFPQYIKRNQRGQHVNNAHSFNPFGHHASYPKYPVPKVAHPRRFAQRQSTDEHEESDSHYDNDSDCGPARDRYSQYGYHRNNGRGRMPFVFRETDSLPHQTESECTTECNEGSGIPIERTTSGNSGSELVGMGDLSPDHSADSISNDPSSSDGSGRRFGRKHTLIPSTTDEFEESDGETDVDTDTGDRIVLKMEHSKSMKLVGMMVSSGFTDPGLASSLQELSRLQSA